MVGRPCLQVLHVLALLLLVLLSLPNFRLSLGMDLTASCILSRERDIARRVKM